ncbi:MAG: phosphate signaling complex protein PhoU [Schaedlerella sp.]|nr:phosphate signaling complex protein PhoU [Lachnospiraceae bacterium]MDY4201915.1 phosphate signaling complex protein PhoU [Schaedlerella sp.]
MRNRFDSELQLLEEMLTHMGELCEVAITNATNAIKDGNAQMARSVIEADEEIDQMEKDIERLCLKLLLQQQPVAKDLRRISAALKMITDMERIGDQTSDIAEIVISSDSNTPAYSDEIVAMAAEVSRMVVDSVTAYVNKDLGLAQEVLEADNVVDNYFDEVRDKLIDYIRQEKGEHGRHIFDLIMVTKYLERIGDHATNISEWVEFSITGVHRKAPDSELRG